MSLGPVINVAIGLIMTFAVMALVVSGAVQALTTFLQTKSSNLREGISQLLNDPTMSGLAGRIFAHAAIHPLGDGTPATPKTKGLPSYIEPRQFAAALIELIQNSDPVGKLGLKDAIDKIEDPQIKTLLSGAYARADGDAAKLHDELAGWFESSMERVRDKFAHNAHVWSFRIALGLALLLNIDAFHIAQAIWASPEMVAAIEELGQTSENSMKDLAALAAAGFPMGWDFQQLKELTTWAGGGWIGWAIAKLAGCLFTAAAALLGAPFWFGLLAQIRGSAPAPQASVKT